MRLHGTDGYRGNIYIEDGAVSYEGALNTALNEDKILPEMFDLLAYSTVKALKSRGIDTTNVLFGRDTRDLYMGIEGKEGRFTRAIIDGIRSSGANVLDMGITPIPNASYMLAHLDYEGAPVTANVAFVKTASHNPKHQDGLKVFYKDKAGRGKYIKLMPDDEEVVTAIAFKTAKEGKETIDPGRYSDVSETAVQVYKQFMLSTGSYTSSWKNALEITDTVIIDLSNGAVGMPPYRQVIDELLSEYGIKNRFYVGVEPNGININEDDPAKGRVGAGHFEGVDVIGLEETRGGGKWGSFPVLEKLFECGMAMKASALKDSGKLLVAILTDGDGDRGYTMVYNPSANNVKLIDGDHSLYLQLLNALENKDFANGETIAFTVESSAGFINAITSLIKNYGLDVNLLEAYDDEPSRDAVNIVITPVGDKYILYKQSLGTESTGHIIKKDVVLAEDGKTQNQVFTGNGILGTIETLSSINNLRSTRGLAGEGLMELILNPYQQGNSHITYCYFVDKKLWERGNSIWKQAEDIINDSLNRTFAQKGGVVIESRVFEREPDTLYTHVLSSNKAAAAGGIDKFILTLHVRPSGTEDKIGVKIFGDDNVETSRVSEEISEKMFALFWRTMKNDKSRYAVQEAEILRLLTEKGPATLASLKEMFTSNATSNEAKRVAEIELSFLIDAMGMKRQRLIKTAGRGAGNDTLITLAERGKTVS